MSLSEQKYTARQVAFAARNEAFAALGATPETELAEVLEPYASAPLAGYLPIRSEISPLAAMAAHAAPVCIPVIQSKGQPLRFARWTPDTKLVTANFGTQVPEAPEFIVPQVLIVPIVAFDNAGNRLGYGGGFYDRTLEGLRAAQPTIAIGFAFEAQCQETLPLEPTDQPLDFIVTEAKVRQFTR
ncbi:5-formyltetrahydrofolate cyclo-ligase [Falsihalocynthiibacter sp. SS001]|uniref:5-formyltetrahydrofolate cyclo-ligase n=1 Tax=Falsihalocynthiibacter sp. SS001 TaxID=3349698 RepID=UPI0036D30826